MNNNDRIRLLSQLQNDNGSIGDGSNITTLDYLIYTEYRCIHEYGIRQQTDSSELCNCLDCGDALEEIHYREIYDIGENITFRDIRYDYLKNILEKSSIESVSILSRNGRIKSKSRKITRISS